MKNSFRAQWKDNVEKEVYLPHPLKKKKKECINYELSGFVSQSLWRNLNLNSSCPQP